MDLVDQILTASKAEHVAPVSQATVIDISQLGTSAGLHDRIAANAYGDRVAALLSEAKNFDLIRAYQHNNGALAEHEMEALAAELRRRNISI